MMGIIQKIWWKQTICSQKPSFPETGPGFRNKNGDPLSAQSEGHVLALGDPARLEDVLEALGNGG